MAACVIVLFRMLIASRPLRAWLFTLNVLGVFIATGFVWWTQSYSSYPKMKPILNSGDQIMVFQAHDQPGSLGYQNSREKEKQSLAVDEEPPKIKLRAVEEEEIFLDASGQSFLLRRPSPPAKEKEATLKTPPENLLENENTSAFINTSTATLLVFFRGWW